MVCDPTEGAFERKFANTGLGESIAVLISNCQGDAPAQALANSDADNQFPELMQLLGSPEYGGTPGSYSPAASSILYPVVFFYREENLQGGWPVESCSWRSIVYQRASNPFFYTR